VVELCHNRETPVQSLKGGVVNGSATRWIVISMVIVAAGMVVPVQALAAEAALWHMDETSGSVMHDAVGNHDGTLSHVRRGEPGFIGTAFGFVRSDRSQVTVPSASDLNPGSGAFTISLHVYATTTPKAGDYDLVKKGSYSSPGGEYKVEMLQSGEAQCAFKGSQHYAAVSGGPDLAKGRWFTVRCTKTSSSVILKVAGTVYSKSISVGSIVNSSAVGIGGAPGSDFTNGRLDEIALIHGT
jgi:hypothetical protein